MGGRHAPVTCENRERSTCFPLCTNSSQSAAECDGDASRAPATRHPPATHFAHQCQGHHENTPHRMPLALPDICSTEAKRRLLSHLPFYSIPQYIILCYIILYYIVLYCIVLYCIVLYCMVWYGMVWYCMVWYCIVLYCIV